MECTVLKECQRLYVHMYVCVLGYIYVHVCVYSKKYRKFSRMKRKFDTFNAFTPRSFFYSISVYFISWVGFCRVVKTFLFLSNLYEQNEIHDYVIGCRNQHQQIHTYYGIQVIIIYKKYKCALKTELFLDSISQCLKM